MGPYLPDRRANVGLAADAVEPALGVLHLELRDALRISFTSTLLGVLPRA